MCHRVYKFVLRNIMHSTSAINNKRDLIRDEIMAYERRKYVKQCVENFSKIDRKTDAHKFIESMDNDNSVSIRSPVKTAENLIDKVFSKKTILATIMAFVFLVCAVLIKTDLFLKQQEYISLVEQTESIQTENQAVEAEYISKTSGPEFLKKIKDLGMIKNEHYVCVNSDKIKEERNK